MKNLLYLIVVTMVFYSCSKSSNKMSSQKSSSSNYMVKGGASGKSDNHKVKASYKSGKYHQSKKEYVKVDDVVRDRSLKNSVRAKKANESANGKFKKKQQEYLIYLNTRSHYNYKDRDKINDGTFDF